MRKTLRCTAAIAAAAMLVSLIPTSISAAGEEIVILNPAAASPFNNGEFEGWGTSLCWWANRMGYSEKLTQQAADAFFSEEGLGLDIARYNLGGGDDPTHNHVTRSDSKIPCYAESMDSDGNITYNWNADENQRNMAKAALKANPDLYFEGFSNSPPYFMTNSGCSSGAEDPNSDNLKSDQYDNFGKFIAEVTKHFKENFGIAFKSYSPMNEPDTSYWGAFSPKQEGCHYSPGETQSKTIIATRRALDAAGLKDVLVAGMDETDINKTVQNYAKLTAEAKEALGRIDTHTYSGSNRSGAKSTAVNAGKDLWMSEVDGGWDGFGIAERIILDMNGMQPSAWVLWDIVDKHKDADFFYTHEVDNKVEKVYSEQNASLNATDSLWGVGMADHDTETLELANKYYFLGQFTRYINPGDTIIASSGNTLAAYNKKSGDIKIIVLNTSDADRKYIFDLSAFTSVGSAVQEIRTNNKTGEQAEHWKNISNGASVNDKKLTATAGAKAVTTYVIKGNNPDLWKEPVTLTDTELSYSGYSLTDRDRYVVVYNENGTLRYIAKNKDADTVNDDFSNCTARSFMWGGMRLAAVNVAYGVITGSNGQIDPGSSVQLTFDTNIRGTAVWSVSDTAVAEISADGVVTAKKSGEFTVFAEINGFKTSRNFTVPSYKLTGTPSWSNDSSRPSDSADYTKAADGDLSTYFDGVQNGWVQYDFGTDFAVSEIKLAARSGSGMPERMTGGAVQGSFDGIEWTELYKLTGAIPAGKYTTVTASQLSNNNAYRYYRYTNTTNMTNIAEFLIEGEPAERTGSESPVVHDISGLSENFEGASDIFGAEKGMLDTDRNVVYASGLERYGNVIVPVKSTARAALDEAITLEETDKLRLTFDMFAGWENNGKENRFVLNNADGEEIVSFKITGGGYNFNEICIGGQNVLAEATISQCRSNPGTNKAGANGWNVSGQPYVNTVGYNKKLEIIIDGSGNVTVSASGGMEDTYVSSQLSSPVTIGSVELKGDYNTARERVVSYDNFDCDVISYAKTQ